MSGNELARYHNVMHHHVTVTLNDGTSFEGHIQPWDTNTTNPVVYFTPRGGVGETKRVNASDIKDIRTND